MIHPLSRRTFLTGAAAAAIIPNLARAAGGEGRRIVSLGGAVTEILYRLGLEAEVVGVDSTSQHPPEALRDKPNVGYVRALGAEGLLSLKPSLVIAVEGAGPPDVLRLVAEAGVPIARVPEDATAAGVTRRIEAVAGAIGAEAAGAALARSVEAGFARLDAARGAIRAPKRALFVLSLQNGRPLVGGRGTTADGMLALAGAVNAAGSLQGWTALSDEGVIAAAPEAVVMMNRGPGGAPADPFALPSFAATPAGAARALVAMDGLYLLGFGPRTPEAALDLMTALHPETRPAARTGP